MCFAGSIFYLGHLGPCNGLISIMVAWGGMVIAVFRLGLTLSKQYASVDIALVIQWRDKVKTCL